MVGPIVAPFGHQSRAREARRGRGWDAPAISVGAIALVVALLLAERGPAQPQPSDPGGEDARALDQFQSLTEEFKQLGDWKPNADLIRAAIERTWRDNGWNTEADEFARQAAGEVSAIPPWDFQGRITRMTDMLGERYAFDEKQRQRLESSIYAETGWFVVRNFKTILEQTRETIGLRSQGRPFTPDLVAKWTRESDGLMADARERLDRIIKSMEKTMTPEQRRLLRDDLESYARRRTFTDQLRERWARGEWRPEDWGLERDPIQTQGMPPVPLPESRPAEAVAQPRSLPGAVLPYDETSWERYVREFVSRYGLDEAQREAAYSILREMKARAWDHRQTHSDALKDVPVAELNTHRATLVLRRMFEELRNRLEPIPTAAQRRSAEGARP